MTASKYVTRVLTTKMSKEDKEKKGDECAQLEANLGDAESRLKEHKKAAAEASKEISAEITKHRTALADASAAIRAGVETREVKCYKKMVGKKEVLFRVDTDKRVDDADIVSGQQLGIDEAGNDLGDAD